MHVLDTSGNDLHMPINGNPTEIAGLLSGITGHALRFDGVDDYLGIANITDFGGDGTGPFSLLLELELDRSGPLIFPIITNLDDAGATRIFVTDDRVTTQELGAATGTQVNYDAPDQTPFRFACTRLSSTLTIYVNGVEVASGAADSGDVGTRSEWLIAARPSTSTFTPFDLGQFEVWDSDLSAQDLRDDWITLDANHYEQHTLTGKRAQLASMVDESALHFTYRDDLPVGSGLIVPEVNRSTLAHALAVGYTEGSDEPWAGPGLVGNGSNQYFNPGTMGDAGTKLADGFTMRCKINGDGSICGDNARFVVILTSNGQLQLVGNTGQYLWQTPTGVIPTDSEQTLLIAADGNSEPTVYLNGQQLAGSFVTGDQSNWPGGSNFSNPFAIMADGGGGTPSGFFDGTVRDLDLVFGQRFTDSQVASLALGAGRGSRLPAMGKFAGRLR